MTEMRIVIGLGNPGDEYVDTRHNIGFRVIDLLADSLKINVRKRKFGARLGEGEYVGRKLILLKPWQFMNRSGQAVAAAFGYYKMVLDDILVVTDDMALEPGRIRLRAKGSAGGHNGLGDIIDKLGTENVARCRIGIGQSGEEDEVEFVLSRPKKQERPLLDGAIERARDAVLCWVEYGIDRAMNLFNPECSGQ